MDDELRRAIFEIRDSLAEVRDILRLQKQVQEKALRESGTAKEALGRMIATLPSNLKVMMEPLTKTES